jgi:chromosome partitioning protein
MAKIISVIQVKGGATKTTTCINLLGALIESGYKAILCDMDKDKPDAMLWVDFSNKMNNLVIPLFDQNPKIKLDEIKNDYDFIILDTPPNLESSALKAAIVSDFIILPCQPSDLDKNALTSASSVALMANKPFKFLPSRVFKNTINTRDLINELEETGAYFKSKIYNSVDMIDCQKHGTWIGSYKPQHQNHIEYKKLVKELTCSV